MKTIKIFGVALAGLVLVLPAFVQAQLTFFPIATNGVAMSYAFDGSNYLVGVENHQTATTASGAQMISSTGTKVGSLITTGRSGIATAVAFDGANYLMIWEDDGMGALTNGNLGFQVYGQFISKAGATNGSPFDISGLGIWFDGIKTMAYGGGKYLVTYTRLINPALGDDSTNRYIAGRIVDPNGTVGSEFRISTGYGAASDVAFDGSNFFVVWCEDSLDTEIRGRFVSPAGVPGTEISVNASAAPSDNPNSVAFDGTHYLVIWNDEVDGSGNWDCFGQLVSTSGTLVGGVITITDESGPQMVTTVAFDGVNFMAAWMDMQNETNWDMYARYINRTGPLIGSKITLSTEAGNQLGGVGFANGQYLALVNNGVEMGEGGISQVDSAEGTFITPLTIAAVDDFNDNLKDSAKWSDDIFVDSGTNAVLEETGGRLEFTGISSETDSAGIVRPWIGSFGSYTQNWEAAVDVHMGAVPLSQNTDISMFLAVVEYGDPDLADHLSMELYLYKDFGSTTRRYSANGAFNNNELDLGMTTTADQQGRLRIAFDASTKILTTSFNGTPLGWMDVDQSETSWGMTNGSDFMIVLGGSMWGDSFTNSGSEVYADNFELRTGDDLDYLLVVNNGSGGGNYTTGTNVTITASAAPAGQVFDHWAGSTQYLANAASATTTVAMPAQAITLTAAYKLTGAGSGDDFNDNSKDATKWGDDIHFINPFTVLLETNGRLELRKEAGVDGYGVLRTWIESVGSYTQSWEVAVDANLGNVDLPSDGAWVNLALAVANRQDTNLVYDVPIGDSLDIALDLFRDNDKVHRGFEMSSRVNGIELSDVPNYGYVSTGDLQGRLKIAFDATTKVLTASYNGNVLGLIDVDAPGSSWDMTGGSTFGIAIAGSTGTEGINITEADVFADNFEVIGMVAPPEDWDGNGLPDWWEEFYFSDTGIDPNALCSNGVNTRLEAYTAGIDPTDPNAFFIITGVDGSMIQWNAVSGRVYNVYWTTNLMDGFQTLETNWTDGTFTDSLHGTDDRCFYKIDVRLED